ncbi:MAG TPA: EAL domain-containing protein [Azospira sp.]|nr:EAL domain-containing protein [Azospira sp.]
MGIRQRAVLLALVPAALIASALAFYYSFHGLATLDAELQRRGMTIVQYLAPASEYGVISGNGSSLQALAQAAMQQPDVRAVVIADSRGRVLAISGRTTIQADVLEREGKSEGLLASGPDWFAYGAPILRSRLEIDDFQDFNLSPRPNGAVSADLVGHVYVEISSGELRQRKIELLLNTLLILLGGLLVTAIMAMRLVRSVTRPVQRLVQAVGQMAGGNLEARVAQSSGGELGDLEHGFNHMATRLQDLHDTMQERIADATAQLAHQASHDPLTGLINRREFERRGEAALLSARDEGERHVLCFVDLDRFKIVNDTSGHGAGDELLRQITHLLQQRVRSHDLLARLGGDEFGILLENCSLEDATQVMDALRQAVEAYRFAWGDHVFSIGASIGLVVIDRQVKSLVEAMAAADQACYAAKELGRNRIHVFQVGDQELSRRQGEMDWASRIATALEEKRLLLYAQPVVPLVTGAGAGLRFEVFLRLLSEQGEMVMPETFLPAAERFDLMPALDKWVIEAACLGLRRLLERGSQHQLLCAINLSAQSATRPEMLHYIGAQLARHGIPPAALCFELTEAAASHNFSEVVSFVQGLRHLGCGFALDDFGSGLSTFTHLRTLPPDYVKIGGSLVRDMADDRISLTLVRAIHDITRQMGVMAVAENVDRADTFAALREVGIEYGQGHWFESPRPFEDWLSGCEERFAKHGEGFYTLAPGRS